MWRVTCDSGFLTCLMSGICAAHFLSLITYSPYREKCAQPDLSAADYDVVGVVKFPVDSGTEVPFKCKSDFTPQDEQKFTCTNGVLETPDNCLRTLYATSDIDHHDG